MKRVSDKRRNRNAEAKPIRDGLIAKAGACMICGARPGMQNGRMQQLNQLVCHEILNGPLRQASLDKPFAILVLCWGCNGTKVENKGEWPVARQLAVLHAKSPEDYDLVAFNQLRNPRAPNYITQSEVDAFSNSVC